MSKMYYILYIYLFILICTGEKVEPWSSFLSQILQRKHRPKTNEWEFPLSLLQICEPDPTSIRQHFETIR